MEEQELINIAKEAYLLAKQLGALEEGLKDRKNAMGLEAYMKNYNLILSKAKRLLKNDEVILASINHLEPHDYPESYSYEQKFSEIGGDVPILKEALFTFYEFHFPKKEKDKIGFR